MKKVVASALIVSSVAGLSACMPTYQMVSQPLPDRMAHKFDVELAPMQEKQTPFERVKLQIKVTNNSDQPIEFSTANVKAQRDGKDVQVMTYKQQYDELYAILNHLRPGFYPIGWQGSGVYYAPSGHSTNLYLGVGQTSIGFGGFPSTGYRPYGFYRVDMDSQMDTIDINLALMDLEYIKEHAVQPTTIEPGQSYSGELTIREKMTASEEQKLRVVVTLGSETHRFAVTARKIK